MNRKIVPDRYVPRAGQWCDTGPAYFLSGDSDALPAFFPPAVQVVHLSDLPARQVKCEYCQGWTQEKKTCEHCGAPA